RQSREQQFREPDQSQVGTHQLVDDPPLPARRPLANYRSRRQAEVQADVQRQPLDRRQWRRRNVDGIRPLRVYHLAIDPVAELSAEENLDEVLRLPCHLLRVVALGKMLSVLRL